MELFLKHKRWLFPLLFALCIAPFTPWLDLTITRHFYKTGNDPVTHFHSAAWIQFMFDYGSYPAIIAVAMACIALLLSIFSRFKAYRAPALVLILTMLVGVVFFVHGILKDHWGRPRPRQVIEFGGRQPFRPFYEPQFSKQPEPSKSFVCGHCSMGFYFLSLLLVARRMGSKRLFWLGALLTIVLGGLLSYIRMAQGGHFFSDILFAAFVMWWTALMMDWLVYAKTPS